MLFGQHIFAAMGMAPPTWYFAAQERKMMVLFGLFILGNNIHSALTSTGAFEITLIDPVRGEVLLWSKLETGNVPSPEALLSILRAKLDVSLPPTSDSFSINDLPNRAAY